MNRYIYALLLAASLVSACGDDDDEFNGPFTFDISGIAEVVPETTETYYLGGMTNPEASTWTVTGPAQIEGTNKGRVVTIRFTSVGNVQISVTNGSDTGIKTIKVKSVNPILEAELAGTGVLKSGVTDTVFLSFPAPLVADPVIRMLKSTDSSAFVSESLAFESGTLGPIKKIDAKHYYALYTAGTGNGTPELIVRSAETTAAYGSVELDTAGFFRLFKVDNITPIADLDYSEMKVKSGTEVTITVRFSEPVKKNNDIAPLISFSGAGVNAKTDTLKATNDPLIYTYTYKVTGSGNGLLTVDIINTVDLGGNNLAIVTNKSALEVDNIKPVVSGMTVDQGDFASLEIGSTGPGTGLYLVLEDDEDAPADVDEFLSTSGVASGSVAVDPLDTETVALVLANGTYHVYFVARDEAGNYSNIVSTSLTMN